MKLALTSFAALLLATACNRHEVAGDAEVQKMLSGVWIAELEEIGGFSTVTNAPDGSYTGTVTWSGGTNGPGISNFEGTWRVQDGTLVDTLTKTSKATLTVPLTSRARIVRLDRNKLVLAYDQSLGASGPTNPVVFRR